MTMLEGYTWRYYLNGRDISTHKFAEFDADEKRLYLENLPTGQVWKRNKDRYDFPSQSSNYGPWKEV